MDLVTFLVVLHTVCWIATGVLVFVALRNDNEICPHENKEIKVITSAATCETTVQVCSDCGEELTDPKIDCI